jgi:hypothetical protein
MGKCEQCGASLKGKREGARYCSIACRVAAHRARAATGAQQRECPECGKWYVPGTRRGRFCSTRCRVASWRRGQG